MYHKSLGPKSETNLILQEIACTKVAMANLEDTLSADRSANVLAMDGSES